MAKGEFDSRRYLNGYIYESSFLCALKSWMLNDKKAQVLWQRFRGATFHYMYP